MRIVCENCGGELFTLEGYSVCKVCSLKYYTSEYYSKIIRYAWNRFMANNFSMAFKVFNTLIENNVNTFDVRFGRLLSQIGVKYGNNSGARSTNTSVVSKGSECDEEFRCLKDDNDASPLQINLEDDIKFITQKSGKRISVKILDYFSGELPKFTDLITNLALELIKFGHFSSAKSILDLLKNFVPFDARLYWGYTLIKLKAKNEEDIAKRILPLTSIDEYLRYLELVDEKRKAECKEIEQKQLLGRKKFKKIATWVSIGASVLVSIAIAITTIVLVIDYNEKSIDATYSFEKVGNSYQITELKNKSLTSIKIPSSYKGTKVTGIGYNAFYNCDNLTSVTIPNTITSIGNSAFYSCDNLKNIVIPSSVTEINNSAFYGCANLKSVTIPSSVTTIGDYVFYNCDNLTNVTIPYGVTSLGRSVFFDCDGIQNITIPKSVSSIGGSAFENCDALETIYIPRSVTYVGGYAFNDCIHLTIYCEVDTKPSGWNSTWNYSNRNVYWNTVM